MSLYLFGNKNVLKRSALTDTISMSAPSVLSAGRYVSTTVVAHNLGYIPMIRLYYEEDASDGKVYPAGGSRITSSYTGLTGNPVLCLWELDTSNLTIYLESFTAKVGTRNVYYVIYKDIV